MNRFTVSVVVETITTRFDSLSGILAEELDATLAALDRQTYPRELIEIIVVLDREINVDQAYELCQRYARVKFLSSLQSNYFAAKNSGAIGANGEIIALLDGDCVPESDWLEILLAPFKSGAEVVGGCTRYTGSSLTASIFSIPDFAYVLAEKQDSRASGFNINNVAFRRETFLEYFFDERIPRNGGCYFLFHRLRAAGVPVLYEPRAKVSHGLDIGGFGFVRKHFDRGYDGVIVYRLDEGAVLRGTRLFRRLGGLALAGITVRRVFVDWRRMFQFRRQMEISVVLLPFFGSIAATTRLIELMGGLKAVFAAESLKE